MTLITIILGLLPGFAWLFFYLQEDLHPEPKRLLVKTFLMGGFFAFLALFAELAIDCGISGCPTGSRYGNNLWLFLIVFALVEEFFKFGAAYISVHKNPALDEPVDAMIYAVTASLGFATIENLGALGFENTPGLLANSFEIASFRFVGATLLHSLASAAVGYYWAVSIREFDRKRFIWLGLAIATALHALFNYLIISYGGMMFPVLLVTVAGFFILNDFEKLKRKRV